MRNDSQPADESADTRWEALARYAAGESSEPETATVRSWLREHPADAALIERVRAGIAPETVAPAVNVEAALARVRGVIDAETRATEGATAETGGSRRSAPFHAPLSVVRGGARGHDRARFDARRSIGLAAAAVVLLAIGFGTYRASRVTEAVPAAGMATRIYRTAIGVRDSIVLADGSRVVLAPGSSLTVALDFDSSRTVQLEGAAFFEVRHDERRPFTVRSGNAVVRDVGTAFSVNTDATGAVAVAVTEGIVAMTTTGAASSAGVELRAGDRGVVPAALAGAASGVATGAAAGATDSIQVSRGIVTASDVAWTRGELVYIDAPVAAVQADLQRWFGIKLAITDSAMLRQRLKISFLGDSAESALVKLALTIGAETVQRGDSVILQPRARAVAPSSNR